ISCAECRRLKLKCDKQLPCGSCVRRGCPSICPNGSLSTGQGTRFVLADTAQLHAKISEMGQRIRQLEDALAVLQSTVSSEPHPLLHESLLSIKFGLEKGAPSDKSPEPVEMIDALGTLTISPSGEARYFGRSAGSEALLMAGEELQSGTDDGDGSPHLPAEIMQLSNIFPFRSEGSLEQSMELLLNHLPPYPRAWSLCETYIEHASWAFRPLKRDEIINHVLTPIYKHMKEAPVAGSNSQYAISPHQLAVLFMIFALGALVDLTLEPYNLESETYHLLSRAALSLRSILDSPEIFTVQAVILMASYHGLGSQRYTVDSGWNLMSLGAKLAQSMGLHRDSARWKLDATTVQRRRALFWEIFTAEQFYSLAIGRPPSIRHSYIDCEFPEDEEATLDNQGNVLVGFHRWKYEFTKEIICSVTELTLTAQPPSYQTVLELDRKLRAKVLPPHLNVFLSTEDASCTPSVYMRGCLLGQFRTIALLYLHRSFFAQAMLDYPSNPLKSPYSPSFLAAYRCASGVIKLNLNHFDRYPELCCRWWSIWTHLFSAAIIVGSIVTRAPSSSMAASAFIELGLAYDLFKKGAVKSRRAKFGLAILDRLRERALQVYAQFRSGRPISNILSTDKPDYGDDELALFGGQTRVLVMKLLSSSKQRRGATCYTSSSATSPASSQGSTESRTTPTSDTPEVHPSLLEYLSRIPQQQVYNPDSDSPTTQPPNSPPSVPTPQVYPTPQTEPYSVAPTQYTDDLQIWQQQLPSADYDLRMISATPYSLSIPPSNGDHAGDAAMSSNYRPESSQGNNLLELGMMMSGDSGMDEQWLLFMRQSGLLETVSSTNCNI
ncbi:hypothetical protein AX16_010317, partial [Volvariella volvacea WC 439]